MQLAYDLHIHTVASPCAHEWMTPHNIVSMAKLKGLQLIAITDHQTAINCEAVMKVGEQEGIIVVPGIEIECAEEFHLIALFKDVKSARQIESFIQAGMPMIKNRKDIFGCQQQMNANNEIIGEIERLLLTATQLSVDVIVKEVRAIGGVIYPAHIDRKSYSILSNLGNIPIDLNFHALEVSKAATVKQYEQVYEKYRIIQSSDAHYIQDISERTHFVVVSSQNLKEVFVNLEKRIVKTY